MLLFIIILVFLAIACALIWFLVANDHGEKEPANVLWIAAGFGFLGVIAAAAIEYFLIPNSYQSGSDQSLLIMLLLSLAVGLIEESCKFLPLASFIYKKGYFNEHTDGIIYFAIAGLAFGIPENILYTLKFGSDVGLARIIMTPIFHAALTAMVGFFLARSKVEHQSLARPALALVAAIVLHGLYDFGLVSRRPIFTVISLMITAGMTATIFVLYMRANELDRQVALSVVGHNNFCRHCGAPNPEQHLYCTHCGQHA